MKKNITKIISLVMLLSLSFTGCKDEFFNRPPESAITIDNFYKTAEQVRASTSVLYSTTWFGWIGKSGWSITELAGGNGRTTSGDVVNFGNFTVTNNNFELSAAWNSLYIVVAQANGVINNLPIKVPATVDQAVVNNALGEAHLMRALAYFHLVRVFGNVPIIENPEDYVANYQINTNPVVDVYKFIVNDLKFAETNCTPALRVGKSSGRVSSGSASALLAKVYLYMRDYNNALLYANKVISSGEFKLYGVDVPGKTFNDLFLTANNNNEESIIQLQWAGNGGYGFGNPQQAAFAAGGITGTGDGFNILGPTFSLQDIYQSGDARRKATFMLAGDFYPEIQQAAGGYTCPANANTQGTRSQMKKYVVGSPADNGGVGSRQSAANNTYMMRYAEVFLIKAEAIMGIANATVSSDPTALEAINVIRRRSNLGNLTVINRDYTVPNPAISLPNPPATTPPTLIKDDILEERRREFAFENDYWFDLGRLDGYNVSTHPRAIAIIAQQDRGSADNATPARRFGNQYTTITNKDFYFVYPASEVAANPKLLEAPVPYKFK